MGVLVSGGTVGVRWAYWMGALLLGAWCGAGDVAVVTGIDSTGRCHLLVGGHWWQVTWHWAWHC